MNPRILFATALLGLTATVASANHDDVRYRVVPSSGGGNGSQHQYRLERVNDTAEPYALTGRQANDRVHLTTNQGGNTRVQFFVRESD
jgi:hypothetical protein